MPKTYEEQMQETAGDLQDDDVDLLGIPAAPRAQRGETVAPEAIDTGETPEREKPAAPDPAAEPARETRPAAPEPETPAPTPPAEAVAVEATPIIATVPKKWAGRFETPEALEAHVSAQERYISELAEGNKRLERLVAEALQGPRRDAPPDRTPVAVPPAPTATPITAEAIDQAFTTIEDLNAKTGLGERLTADDRKAYTAAQRTIQLSEGGLVEALVEPVSRVTRQRLTTEDTQQKNEVAFEGRFFGKYPQFQPVNRALLGTVAQSARTELMRANPDYDRWTDAQWDARLIDAIGIEAGKTFVVAPAADPTPPAGEPDSPPTRASAPAPASVVTPSPPTPKAVPSGARSEGPGSLRPPAPKLSQTEQEMDELAEFWVAQG